MNKQVYMAMPIIGPNQGGMTSAVLTRSKIFYDYDISANVITFDYNMDYKKTLKQLVKLKKIDSKTKIINMYNYLDNQSCKDYDKFVEKQQKILDKQKQKAQDEQKQEIQDNQEQDEPAPVSPYEQIFIDVEDLMPVRNNATSIRYFDPVKGTFVCFIKFEKNGDIRFVDYLTDFKRNSRVEFYKKKKKRVSYFDRNYNVIGEILYNKYEQPFLTLRKKPQTGAVLSSYLLNKRLEFSNSAELGQYFLKKFLGKKECTVLIDSSGMFNNFMNLNLKNAKLYSVIHQNHKPNMSELAYNIKRIFDNADNLDKIIILTDKQKQDIVDEYNLNNLLVIPNFQKISEINTPKDKGEQFIISNVSRLDKDKGFDRLCLVAKEVKKIESNLKFHLYGIGDYRAEIENLILENNLEDTVFLKGYTNDIKGKLENEINLLISTSYTEGLPYNLIEAMERAVPVVAFDIKYGPSDIIVDGETGYLIEDDNIQDMADKIIHLYNNPDVLRKFGENSRKRILDEFSVETIMKKWMEIL